MRISAILCAGVAAYAQPSLDRPTLGTMLDANGIARPVYGISGSVTLGEVAASGVLSSACSRQLCLMKTGAAILSADGSVPAPPGPAIFALDGAAAWVYFPLSKQLARWQAGELDFLSVDIAGDIQSIRAGSDNTIDAVIRRGDRVWIARISAADGSVTFLGSLPRAAGPMMLLGENGVTFASRDGLVLRREDGSEIRFHVKNVSGIFALGEGYVEVRAGQSMYALRVDSGHERLFLLPEIAP